ncbi:hypothetical protein ACN3ZE_002168 [Providencia rettgeri]|uniref:hypothetical protein n=1 Tax=Providencia huaxiensis TaxID=2027290 RepID=UPI003202C853
MTIIGTGEKKAIEGTLNVGVKNVINLNKPARYTMTTAGGTTISGVIPANGNVEVTNGGDITSFNIYIDDIDKTLKTVE